MGIANKVPGVSGGLVALVMGFYEPFIFSLQRLNVFSVTFLLKGKFKKFAAYTNFQFLFFLILGMLTSFFLFSAILDYLLAHFRIQVWASFFGMILASIYFVSLQHKDFFKSNKSRLFVFFGLLLGIVISLLSPAQENENGGTLLIIISGMLSVTGMVLPGLSGSFLLILLGNYKLLLVDSVNVLVEIANKGFFKALEDPRNAQLAQVLLLFGLGSLLGLLLFSNVLKFLLKNYKSRVYDVIIGFVVGSLPVVWPWRKEHYNEMLSVFEIKRYLPSFEMAQEWYALVFIFFGFLLVFILEIIAKKNAHKSGN